MMRLTCSILALTLALCACTPMPPPPPPESVKGKAPKTGALSAITKDSPVTPALVSELLASEDAVKLGTALNGAILPDGKTQLDVALDGIRSGNDAWLRVAPGLKAGLDAGAATRLKLALGAAISANPVGVLRVLGGPLPVADYCAVALIEPAPAVLQAYRDAAITALEGVTDPALAEKKTACLAAVRG